MKEQLVGELFDWTTWDDQGDFMLSFSDITLKQQIGRFPVGTKFAVAFVDFVKGFVQFCNLGKPISLNNTVRSYIMQGEYRLHFKVGEIITEP